MRFQKSQPAGADNSASTGPLKNMDASSPAQKRTPTKCTKKLAAFRTLANCHGPYGTYEEEALHKAGVGASRPRVQRWIIRMRVIMTAVYCSPAVASRRAKNDDDFRVPTLLGAQPLDAKYRHGSRT